jgi:hypothetical protein
MRNVYLFLCFLMLLFIACQKNETVSPSQNGVSAADLAKIDALGFNSDRVHKIEGGFVVEGDIFLSHEDLQQPEMLLLNAATFREEHYRTPNIVTGTPRPIRVFVNPAIPLPVQVSVDSALIRYNSLGLTISFIRVTSPADINIQPLSTTAAIFGVSGFPTAGNPFPTIQLNLPVLTTWVQPTVTTSIAHLIGHAIGFLHTDQMSPSFSCSGAAIPDNIPASPSILIPGTPSGPSAGSWMLTCISNGINRPFTPLDITALNFVY